MHFNSLKISKYFSLITIHATLSLCSLCYGSVAVPGTIACKQGYKPSPHVCTAAVSSQQIKDSAPTNNNSSGTKSLEYAANSSTTVSKTTNYPTKATSNVTKTIEKYITTNFKKG